MIARFLACIALVWITVATTAIAESAADSAVVLDRLIAYHQGWGELGIDTCAHAPGVEPLRLRIGDTDYERGIGTHAPGELVFMLDGEFARFEAELGVQPQNNDVGSVTFSVIVDGQTKFASATMREMDAPVPVAVDLTGADELRIVIGDAGDGIACDVSNIGNPHLIPDPDAPTRQVSRLDIAPFARVMTWGPDDSGTETKRTEPFIADDVYMGFLLERDPDGTYEIPVDEDGTGCIGLEWAERRLLREVALHINDINHLPPLDSIRLQVWAGESPWQGEWHDVETSFTIDGNRVASRIATPKDAAGQGHEKVRWIVPESPVSLRVTQIEARSFSRTTHASLRVETVSNEPVPVHLYNGYASNPNVSVRSGELLSLDLTIADARLWKGDRTVLQFDLPRQPVAVAVDDVFEAGHVYVPAAGILVASDASTLSIAEARAEVARNKTLLDKVRTMPDQTLDQAFEHVHNPIQDLGPTMLSLAADNRKFVAHRNGAVTFHSYDRPDDEAPNPDGYIFRLETRIDGEIAEPDTRVLSGEWLPAPEVTWRCGSVTYTQRVFVSPMDRAPVDPEGWLHAQAACVIELEARVDGATSQAVNLESRFAISNADEPAFEAVDSAYAAFIDAAARAVVVADENSAIEPALRDGRVVLSGTLEPGEAARMRVILPAWPVDREGVDALRTASNVFDRFERYWERVLARAMQIEVPDAFLTNLIRASQIHILLAARNEGMGERIAAWISSDRYGPLESEAHAVIRGMDLMGHDAFARRSLDFFVHRYAPEG